MRRILLLMVVAVVTATMMAASALPAFADPGNGNGAGVVPHECFSSTLCYHVSETPSGNVNEIVHFHP